ncbi:MAG: hypothetical protein QXV21_05365 [Candidatus Bathyarchaeia archaeon]
MSETENPVDTVVRLLQKEMQVIKDDNSMAKVHVSSEWCDRELFRSCDTQITVGLAESRDTKIEMSGRLRRRLATLRVNVWSQNRQIRNKAVEEVNRVVRQNRNCPNETTYTFFNVNQTTNTHKTYSTCSMEEPNPEDTSWTEIANADYEKLWYSDDDRYQKSTNINDEYALMLFRFKIESRENTVKKIVLAFEGYGTAPAGNGVTIKVWNHVAGAWQNSASGTGEADETITITLTSNWTDYIDDDGYVWLIAKTTNPSDGATQAILHCDYVSCTITVNGITHLDIVSFRDADRVDIKPFIYRTEFALKSWLFEEITSTF